MRRQLLRVLTFSAGLAALFPLGLSAGEKGRMHSVLWGEAGERWSAAGRLPDFSYAGYHYGENPLPRPPVKADVRKFGARGDGKTDDTGALRKALAAVDDGAVLVPEGRYRITGILGLEKSGVVLRGAGPDKTVLYCPKTMDQIEPARKKRNWAWGGGMLWIRQGRAPGLPPDKPKILAEVAAPAKRGERALEVSAVGNLKKGETVELTMTNPHDGSLFQQFYNARTKANMPEFREKPIVTFVSRIERVTGKSVVLERPLRLDVKLAWKPVLRPHRPAVAEVGIEDLAIEFPKAGGFSHFGGPYYNAICLSRAAHCWIRNVKITNAYYGISLKRSDFCTITGVVLDGRSGGHHGICPYGDDNLITDFDVRTTFIHDLCVTWTGSGNVYSNGKGRDLNFDHHRAGPYENLFTNVDVGRGTRVFSSSGKGSRGRHAAARNTCWNIRCRKPIKLAPKTFGVELNFVGVQPRANTDASTSGRGRWVEPVDPARLRPANLHEAQLKRRLNARGMAPPAPE